MSGAEWPSEIVGACLVRVSTPSGLKLQTKDYRPSGIYPVVDQGQELIAGWTDDATGVISAPLPLIVFGDHTRAFKFIDFPFVRGADGTQLLKPRSGIDPLYFFYACRAIDLPSRGYNRHFSILKEKTISLPQLNEQTEIASVLRQVERDIDLQKQQLSSAEQLKRAAMRELFTRGLRGEAQKETEIGLMPESWSVQPLSRYIDKPDYGFTASAADQPIGPKFLRITDIQEGSVDWERVPYCKCDQSTFASKKLRENDIVVARIGATTGKAFLIGECPDAVFASYLIRLRARERLLMTKFLYYFMQSDAYWLHIDQHKDGQLKGGVNIPILISLRIPMTHTDEQCDIVAILDAIDRKIDLHKRKRAVLEDLFRALLHNLMTTEIRVADLDLSALDASATAGAAA